MDACVRRVVEVIPLAKKVELVYSRGEVVSQQQKDIPDCFNDDGYRVPTQKRGAKMFSDIPFPDTVSDADIGRMARLSKLMIGDSNMLGYRTRAGIKAYTIEDIYKLVGLSDRRGRDFIARMVKGKMIKNFPQNKPDGTQVDEYYINPAHFFSGKRINLNLYLLFREQLDPILPQWVRFEFMSHANKKAIIPKQKLKVVTEDGEVLDEL